ncbi:MAG: non-canonical purine NTP pyrophosphatase [Thermoanaerobaculia bacterium]
MTPPPRFTLVTGNPGKLAEARRLCPLPFDAFELDLPEIQSLSFAEVARAKADEAWRHLGRPLVVEEAGLELAAWNGFPGPLVKWMLEAAGAAGIARTALALSETRATARCLLLYRDAEREILAEGVTPGRIVEPRGDCGFGWDPIFLPEGSNQTFAELTAEQKDTFSHRGRAWRDLVQQLTRRSDGPLRNPTHDPCRRPEFSREDGGSDG